MRGLELLNSRRLAVNLVCRLVLKNEKVDERVDSFAAAKQNTLECPVPLA